MRLIDADALAETLGITDIHCCHKCALRDSKDYPAYTICSKSEDFVDACSAIERAPEIAPEPKWIPCNARLPHDSKKVLCCNKTGRIIIGYIGLYEMGERKTYIAESEHDYMNDVIAWLPLPEPYKGK